MTLARTLSIVVASSPHRLEGRHVAGRPDGARQAGLAVVAPPHPMYGGTLSNPVVRAMERALAERGHATLAFNFRGTGESDGEPSGEYDDALADYLGAARALPDQELVWLSGYSFGSVAALAAAVELSAERVLMVAPPIGMLDPALLTRFRGELAVLIGTDDEYSPVEPFRELFERRPRTTIELLPDVDHFFSGSQLSLMEQGLSRLLERTCPRELAHAR